MKLIFSIVTSLFLFSALNGAAADTSSHDHKAHEDHGAHGDHDHGDHGDHSDHDGHDHASGMMVKNLVIRATTPQAGATAAYAHIHNHSDHDDILLGAFVSFAKKTEIHEMALIGDVMKMRPLEDGIAIPAGDHIALEKGGNHIMMMGLSAPIQMGQTYDITLHFKKAGKLTYRAETISLAGKNTPKHHQH